MTPSTAAESSNIIIKYGSEGANSLPYFYAKAPGNGLFGPLPGVCIAVALPQPHRLVSMGMICFFRERILGRKAQLPSLLRIWKA